MASVKTAEHEECYEIGMKKKVVDDRTRATDEGTLRISRAEYARYDGNTFLGSWYRYLNSFLPISRRFRNVFGGFRWNHYRERFMYGDTNPAMILDVRARLVAAYTNLDNRLEKRFPVVRIFAEELDRLPSPPKEGDTFAAVSLYAQNAQTAKSGRWSTFHPLVVDCVVSDRTKCEFRKAMIPEAQWKALELGLSQIPDKTRPGVYDITLPDELKALL